tara:strand:- start:276 stop:479 length:204 start_codon:yes stop_codon:yes gene_type:complete
MSLTRPDENEKQFFIKHFKELTNWSPHLTLNETIKLTQEKLNREKQKHPQETKLKKWLHFVDTTEFY